MEATGRLSHTTG
jgi:hypothetical protein